MAGTSTISVSSTRPRVTGPLPSRVADGSGATTTRLARGQRVGAWKIERELGAGGMSAVYAVLHAWSGKRAALKLAHPSILGGPFTPELFLREARIANRIDHAGVIDVFASGTHDGRPYLVMERLSGHTLGERLDAGVMPRGESLGILVELCEVLAAAHAAGVVHRDLKLDNIYLLAHRGAGCCRLKLLDWGVATLTGEPDPLAGMIAGTLTYVAPEQLRGEALTPAADVYSLGVLAYRMLLGAPPFASPDDLELLHMHLRAAPPRPSSRWPEIPTGLDELLLAMLEKLPAARPPLAEVTQGFQRARRALVPLAPAASRPRWPRHDAVGALLGLAIATASLGSLFG